MLYVPFRDGASTNTTASIHFQYFLSKWANQATHGPVKLSIIGLNDFQRQGVSGEFQWVNILGSL